MWWLVAKTSHSATSAFCFDCFVPLANSGALYYRSIDQTKACCNQSSIINEWKMKMKNVTDLWHRLPVWLGDFADSHFATFKKPKNEKVTTKKSTKSTMNLKWAKEVVVFQCSKQRRKITSCTIHRLDFHFIFQKLTIFIYRNLSLSSIDGNELRSNA